MGSTHSTYALVDAHISCESLEPYTILLNDSDCQLTSLAGVDIPNDAFLTFVGSTDDFTFRSVFHGR